MSICVLKELNWRKAFCQKLDLDNSQVKGFNQLTLSMPYVFLHQVCLQSIPCGLIEMY